jgi:hypothetical protein
MFATNFTNYPNFYSETTQSAPKNKTKFYFAKICEICGKKKPDTNFTNYH